MNLPNRITLFRIFLVPAFLVAYLARPLGDGPANQWLALSLFVTAAVTDALDGYLARRLGLVTNFGKLVDPLADKLLVCSALVAFVHTGAVPVWAAIVIVAREFYVSGFRQLALEQGLVLAAGAWGKIKMGLQLALIIYIIVPPPLDALRFGPVVTALVALAVLATLYSAADYTWRNRSILGQKAP